MEYLRWVLLAVGVIFVVFVYLWSRQQRNRNAASEFDDYNKQEVDDSVEFGSDDWNEYDEHVGDVRIIARENDDVEGWSDSEPLDDFDTAVVNEVDQDIETVNDRHTETPPEVIILHILAAPEQSLPGDKINSVARSNGLIFGDMNIFHRLDENEHSVFSLANMVEPGSFDAETLHTMTTPGLTFFMQPEQVDDPADVFDDMLRCAYRMSEILGAKLCNQHRQPLTENDAEYYREILAGSHGG